MTTESQDALTTSSQTCERAAARKIYRPRVDVIDAPEAVILVADVPGADEATTEVTLERDLLTIRANVAPTEPAEQTSCCAEYGVGDYERRFRLSDEIDRDGVEATVNNGVLRIELPKAKTAAAKKISVTARK